MNQDIENIIDKKHNELFKINFNLDYNTKLNLQRAILDSLADEVLKVVVEKLEKVFDKHCNYSPKKIESEEEYGYNKGLIAEAKLLKFEILQLLSEHLSPNKENKNNG